MYVHARVSPNSRHTSLETKDDIHFNIAVKESAKNNEANRKVVELLANHFNVREQCVRIVNGHHSPSKLITIQEDCSPRKKSL